MAGAAVGLLAGLGFDLRRRGDSRLLAAASQEALLTAALVTIGAFALQWFGMLDALPWPIAVLLGICAASSASPGDEAPNRAASAAMRVVELDDVLPIIIGGIALAFVQYEGVQAPLLASAQLGAVALLFAAAGWLLVSRTSSEIEQRVFVIGTLLLLGGGAAYLSLSELFAGFAAGVLWNRVTGVARAPLEAGVHRLQHPLVALLLLVAGARCRVSGAALALAGVYLVFRTAGKLAGGRLAVRIVKAAPETDLGLHLVSPGVVAVAFALNALQVGLAAVMETLLSAVVLGSLGSELLSWIAPPPRAVE